MTDIDADAALLPREELPGEEEQEPLRDVIARLIASGRDYAEAELDRQKLRAALVGAGVRTAAILLVVALILLFAALVTLLIGLVIALAPLLTPLGATAAVSAGGIGISIILALAARGRIRHMLADIRQ
ncbi:hypothetical protein [Sphingobium aquiterrae]|uniref:hypothetical protein n=1 Tax=Sphingobium aquiterrae TaxID=2038656 RepID=UPI0030199294